MVNTNLQEFLLKSITLASVLTTLASLDVIATESGVHKTYLEEASGGEDREDWFEKAGCPESSKVGETECKQLQKEWG